MIRRIKVIFLVGILITVYSCQKSLEELDNYKRPSWLAGKVYTQLSSEGNLKTFAACVKRVGYDTILNTSGCYTVFAPNDSAFNVFFKQHPNYNSSVENIPYDTLLLIVKSHIINDPWSVEQLRQLDEGGWIDTLGLTNNKPKGFKRETLVRDKNIKFGIAQYPKDTKRIVDTTQAVYTNIRYTDGNKFAPIFYKQYFDIYKLPASDYQFYYDRPFQSSAMYYMGAQIVKSNIFAENGFIHVIDKVNEPIQSAYDILKSEKSKYSKFLDLINMSVEIDENLTATQSQFNYQHGLTYDTLFDVNYPNLAFNIMNEKTGGGNSSVRNQNGLIAPTNEAFDQLMNDILVGSDKWGDILKAPAFFRRIIANTYMSKTPIYPSLLNDRGYLNGESDYMKFDLSSVVEKKFGSNSSFIGVNKPIMPIVFRTVAGPVYLRTSYEAAMYAIEASGILSQLKDETKMYSFFVENNYNCTVDSTLITWYDDIYQTRRIVGYDLSIPGPPRNKQINYTSGDLRTLLYNHVGTSLPQFNAKKEFIRNLAGNYIIIDNTQSPWVASGSGGITVKGINGKNDTIVNPYQISDNFTTNGVTYEISSWMNFNNIANMYNFLTQLNLSKFLDLLAKAGLADKKLGILTFTLDNDYYTVFAPTNAAFAASSVNYDAMPIDQLKKALLMYFVHGDLIFTDGKKPAGYYETLRKDDKSTDYTVIYTKLYIETGLDVINFRNVDHSENPNYTISVDQKDPTNVITGSKQAYTTPPPFPAVYSNGVIHEINTLLEFGSVDTN